MHVLIGECTGVKAKAAEKMGWGRMWVARKRNIYTYPGEPWGFDNGAYGDWCQGLTFSKREYEDRLAKAMAQPEPPYVAVLPDIVASGQHSLELSAIWRDRVPDEWPWHLAVQDGMTTDQVQPYLDMVAGLFLGGTNRFKATAQQWCDLAHAHGKLFHYGRCSTVGKLEHARQVGADSIDGTQMMWSNRAWRRFVYHWQHQPQLTMAL